jgi:Flp pilus assembly pilin Flp
MLNTFSAYVTTLILHGRREDGQTMAEYGILITAIVVVVIVAAILFGSSVSAMFNGDAARV